MDTQLKQCVWGVPDALCVRFVGLSMANDPNNPLTHFSYLGPKIWHIKHMGYYKPIVSVGYPSGLTIYEVSCVQSEDFVHKYGFCDNYMII